MFCDNCNHLGFIIMFQNGYEFIFDCHCRHKEKYGKMPRYFVEDKEWNMKVKAKVLIQGNVFEKTIEIDDDVLSGKGYAPSNRIYMKVEDVIKDMMTVDYEILDGKYKGENALSFPKFPMEESRGE